MMLFMLLQSQAAKAVTHKAAQEFGEMDPYGVVMMIIAMSVVFTGLILLYLTFKYVAKFYNLDIRNRLKRRHPDKEIKETDFEETSGEINAAIALALHMYRNQLHDMEDTVITIQKVAKTYSPWSSKIYGLRRAPK
ncbi:MAG TPA: OadG family protein [Bacteroidales bacterium]|nr:OadG family protein [Bacteroidales bacterium]